MWSSSMGKMTKIKPIFVVLDGALPASVLHAALDSLKVTQEQTEERIAVSSPSVDSFSILPLGEYKYGQVAPLSLIHI